MRRGLISHSNAELPEAVLDARVERVRAAMMQANFDVLVLYTNNTRAAGVSWLTGFVPYWSEALLVLARDWPPILVVALTYRVKSWIERTSRVADVIHGPRVGQEAARVIAASKGDAIVAIPDLAGMPSGIVEDLRAGGPRLVLTDASAMFARLRGAADPAEIALAAKAGWIAHCALAQASEASVAGGCLGTIIAAAEWEARRLGAEEVYIAAAPDLSRDARFRRIEGEASLGASFALRATVAYKGTWLRLVRTFAEPDAIEEGAHCLAAAAAQLPSDRGFAGFSSWLVEGCRIAQPLEPLLGSRVSGSTPISPGALVSVQGRLTLGGQPMLVGAPALLGLAGEAASVLIHPTFEM
jgi:Creatinase/Prolidase N-terminal domain